jgi:hypothetical protein
MSFLAGSTKSNTKKKEKRRKGTSVGQPKTTWSCGEHCWRAEGTWDTGQLSYHLQIRSSVDPFPRFPSSEHHSPAVWVTDPRRCPRLAFDRRRPQFISSQVRIYPHSTPIQVQPSQVTIGHRNRLRHVRCKRRPNVSSLRSASPLNLVHPLSCRSYRMMLFSVPYGNLTRSCVDLGRGCRSK